MNKTGDWVGSNVCNYTGVFCSEALDDKSLTVVSGVDLNHADIAAHFPAEMGYMTDLALIHINSNRFCGIVPKTMSRLKLMYEFDISTIHPPPVSSPPPVHSPPPPVKPPPAPVYSPPPPVHSAPPPLKSPPPRPTEGIHLPPNFGFQYSSPPPPMFPGY
ncbi:hypothetical protein ERO13_A04G121501v2 [Gossypium hirsutum]|nr:hypothetical protein ERO13_A04G121501v2 [Gossypium hirsutum]